MRGWPANGRGAASLFGVLLGLPLSGCIVYDRERVDEPIPAEALNGLQPGQPLAACLQQLGAPNQVYEYRGDGMALLWAWRDADQWSIDLSLPLQDKVSASFDLDLADTEAQGCMLWFDPELQLERFRTGRIGDLVPKRTRPDAIAAGGG